ncbi:MAG TPA: hypothetical protein VFU51_01400 [Gaiellaceae bacterium]|nr:hypothetical protein [Gaiellaceae bacterium]
MIPEPRLVTSRAGTLAVRVWSENEGTPLVFWHALGPCASGAEVVELAPRLTASGIAAFSVDGPGFGASPMASAYDLGSLADLLRATVGELIAGYAAGVFDRDGKVLGSPAEAMALARSGLLDRLSPAWAGLAGMPVLLLLATKPPHVDQNREHLPRFQAAVPHADVCWVDGAGHGVIADAGPALGDEVAEWIRSSGA